jgi:hypothetical protein
MKRSGFVRFVQFQNVFQRRNDRKLVAKMLWSQLQIELQVKALMSQAVARTLSPAFRHLELYSHPLHYLSNKPQVTSTFYAGLRPWKLENIACPVLSSSLQNPQAVKLLDEMQVPSDWHFITHETTVVAFSAENGVQQAEHWCLP